jgi:hypothetical protein
MFGWLTVAFRESFAEQSLTKNNPYWIQARSVIKISIMSGDNVRGAEERVANFCKIQKVVRAVLICVTENTSVKSALGAVSTKDSELKAIASCC